MCHDTIPFSNKDSNFSNHKNGTMNNHELL